MTSSYHGDDDDEESAAVGSDDACTALEMLVQDDVGEEDLHKQLYQLQNFKYPEYKHTVLGTNAQTCTYRCLEQCQLLDKAETEGDLKKTIVDVRNRKEEMNTAREKATEYCSLLAKEYEAIMKLRQESTESSLQNDLLNKQMMTAREQKGKEADELAALEKELAALNVDVDNLKASTASGDAGNEQKLAMEVDQLKAADISVELEKTKRYLNTLSLLQDYSSIKSHTVKGDELRVTLRDPANNKELNITIQCKHHNNDLTPCKAKISDASVYIDDILTESQSRSSGLAYLIQQIHERWINHVTLEQEIIDLREKYALDWQNTTHVVQVLFGKTANTLVELQLPRGYPYSGNITLKTLKHDHIKQDTVTPSNSRATLSQWLEHLHGILEASNAAALE